MNGTVIDIPGIAVSVFPFTMEDSTDMAYTIKFSDNEKAVEIDICFGKITEVKTNTK